MRAPLRVALAATMVLMRCAYVEAAPIIVTFDTFSEGDTITNQFPGLTFSGPEVLTAGSTLNEFEFPPRSGSNAIAAPGGTITIVFSKPVAEAGGYFTYAVPVILLAFDVGGAPLGASSSHFLSNLALSGSPGSAPNELITVAFPDIARLLIFQDPAGGPYTLDDFTYTPAQTVPEPTSAGLTALAGIGWLVARSRRPARSGSPREA